MEKVSLYERLPEIYRIKDSEQQPPYQLKNYLALVEQVFGNIKENIETLYHDHFIETCSDWVIPYIGDLLGTSNLSGDAWTLRADVADTIALRRRKGTLGAIERLTYDLTEWGVHCVELRENLLWTQHLNHQRPDKGGDPPYGLPSVNIHTPIRGGTVTLRDPAILSLLETPFDPFAHIVDLKPPALDGIRYNLPNLAIFLWRLEVYQVLVSKPKTDIYQPTNPKGNDATYIVRVVIHPMGDIVKLYNTKQFQSNYATLNQINPLAKLEEEPIQIPRAFLNKYPVVLSNNFSPDELNKYSPSGNPDAYVSINAYEDTNPLPQLSQTGKSLQMYFPASIFPDWSNSTVKIRGENLLHWEACLNPPLQNKEVAIDPMLGRIEVGTSSQDEADAIQNKLLLSYTYATSGSSTGSIGANPKSYPIPMTANGETVKTFVVNFFDDPKSLENTLKEILELPVPVIAAIKITDSMTHTLDLSNIINPTENNTYNISLSKTLYIQADDEERPVIKLVVPLRFRPARLDGATMSNLTVHLEGLYITRDENFQGSSLIERAALNKLEIVNCTLDPGGNLLPDYSRSSIQTSMNLQNDYGFTDPNELNTFNQTPEVIIQRTITGPLFISTNYSLNLTDSIIDAGSGVDVDPKNAQYALTGDINNQPASWGPPIQVSGITVFGRMRVERINGRGGIWVHALEVNDNQTGCIKFSYFAGETNRLPQNFACVMGDKAHLKFENEYFGEPDYGQLGRTSDFQIMEKGPKDDAMGATGFLLEAHKWKNLQIRFREFMPVGVRSLLLPVPVMEF